MLVLFAALAASAQAAPRSFYGVSSQTPLESSEIDRMGAGRVGSLRAVLSWSGVDPTAAAGDYQWFGFDAIVADAARNGIEVLPFVYGSPEWVAKGLDHRRCGSGCDAYAPHTAPARAAWGSFVGDAVDRYGPGGEFWAQNPGLPQRPIRGWQIWNEQNSESFYRPRPTVKGYARLLGAAADAIRSRDSGADVVLGGMAGLQGSRKATTGWQYLHQLYRRGGTRRDFDGVAAHPYGSGLSKVRSQVKRFRDEITRARDPGAGLWITEIGWGSAGGGNPLNVGKRGQASRLREAYRYFERERRRLNIETVTWFSWRDSRARICEWCPTSGLFTRGLEPKPAWRAFTRLTPGR